MKDFGSLFPAWIVLVVALYLMAWDKVLRPIAKAAGFALGIVAGTLFVGWTVVEIVRVYDIGLSGIVVGVVGLGLTGFLIGIAWSALEKVHGRR